MVVGTTVKREELHIKYRSPQQVPKHLPKASSPDCFYVTCFYKVFPYVWQNLKHAFFRCKDLIYFIFVAHEQEHQFGYPYQLGHQEAADHPQDAMLTHIAVRAQCWTHRAHPKPNPDPRI